MRTRLLGTSLFAASLALGLCGGFAPPGAFAADYLQRARAALAKGNLDVAQIELRNAVRSDPRSADARFLLAEYNCNWAIRSPRKCRPRLPRTAATMRAQSFR